MKTLSSILIMTICLVLFGCATLPTVTNVMTTPNTEKIAYAQKNFTYSIAHKQWAMIEEGGGKTVKSLAKPKNDPAALKKVKKVAIVSFDVTVFRKGEKRQAAPGIVGGIVAVVDAFAELERVKKEMAPLQEFVNQMYTELQKGLEKNGYVVMPVDKILTNEAYKNLEYKEEEKKVKGAAAGWWKGMIEANGMKSIEAVKVTRLPFGVGKANTVDVVIEKVTRMQNLAKALGVDAVIVVDNTAALQWNFTGQAKLGYGLKVKGAPGINIDVFSAAEPRLIWSASLKPEIGCPTKIKASPIDAIMKWISLSLDKFGPDLVITYRDLADLAVLKMVDDAK